MYRPIGTGLLSSLCVIDYVESSICEEERRSNPDNQLVCWIASCLAMTRSVSEDYLTTIFCVITFSPFTKRNTYTPAVSLTLIEALPLMV